MKTITFYSYKGGVGRSLALANIATKLAEFGKKVCMLDFDLEAPGLHIKFGDYISSKDIKPGIVDYIYEFSNHHKVPENIIDFTIEIGIQQDPSKKIFLISAGDPSVKDYWKKLALLNWNKLFYEKNSLGVDFFYNLKAQIAHQIAPDFLLIDSRTGITDIAGITMSILADEIVLMAANNKENLDGIGQVLSSLVIPKNTINNSIPKINIVLSRIPFFADPKEKPMETNIKNAAIRNLNNLLLKKEIHHFKVQKIFVIHSDSDLEMQESFKINPKSNNPFSTVNVPITTDYLELFEELTTGMFGADEIGELGNFRNAVILFERALNSVEVVDKIRLLADAVKLYPNYHHAYFFLGLAYYQLNQYEKSLESFDNASKISSQYDNQIIFYRAAILEKQGQLHKIISLLEANIGNDYMPALNHMMLGTTYSKLKNYTTAINHYKEAISLDPENPEVWNFLAHILRMLGRFEEGFDAVYKALDLNPQFSTATCTLAELHAATGNKREFYKNFDLALSFGLKSEFLQRILKEDSLYKEFFNDKKFLAILEKYQIELDWDILKTKN
ncbi:KGGVGR-motif variant AAA ATPase [Chitinophaga caseinilytica]|uniref:Tetratricopeptide repeat protein n=1 Tax=Chitinophaga caseinilytica TaxID=2267521 RepID=A0ABZ2Z7S8_9BACT